MKTIITTLLMCAVAATSTKAQQQTAYQGPGVQPYGKVDVTDLQMKECDFEKDANAMVLFDKGLIWYDSDFNINMERHKRIKIFNDNGKNEANVRLEFYSTAHFEYISGLEAQTINMVNGKAEVTKLDKKSIFTEVIDKSRSAYVFTFPNVKPGSIIEYKYKWGTNSLSNMPSWYFQGMIPTRYSEVDTQIPDVLSFREQNKVRQLYVLNKPTSESRSIGFGDDAFHYSLDGRNRALANIRSAPNEPYMFSPADNMQSIFFTLTYIKPVNGFTRSYSDSWAKVGGMLAEYEDFGGQLKKKIDNEDAIITKAKGFKTNSEKIAYIYKEVQSAMKWNEQDRWYTNEGISKAWEKKTGNSAEINLILYHLLYRAGVEAFPMVVSTRNHGRVNPAFTFLYQFNRAVVYVPGDSTVNHILDATGKYNSYTETPDELLNSSGLYIDKDHKKFDMVFISKKVPAQRSILINADIKPDGKMDGNAQIANYSYNRITGIKRYKSDGEQKYIDFLRGNDNNIKISELKMENMEDDSLPLNQALKFKMDLTGSDGNYIYFHPAQFSPLKTNPFLSETRYSDIDFGYRDNFSLMGNYTIPAGYKIDVLPKSTSLVMPDKSISFRRLVFEEDGKVSVRYTVDHKKVIHFKEEYDLMFDFYKQLHELMNEQIVLKKI
ncbi:DUF3857 domain-containing protein [Mucilaginibacter myungsuensis]|uniref:DUF3857 domain-containing protein n=1 Tax=Mucilaginibacter myungsuensis TaxID=649104 RepID=A0A929PYI8_9SPHI|nr:DUF3857 domain-containing protein [Mucilaginibacter myungsuensis]MBE9663382.1 DUF3857 domain-containing protein [Mucilaginibacter myungsuensis]MDN3600119.1 DUF3857 domain-containing protein [Mucilaginibacter myungsuensis]